MKCHQCDKPAISRMGSISLCLGCASQMSALIDKHVESLQSEMNYFSDQISAAAGLPVSTPRYAAPPQPVSIVGTNVNTKIEVSNSVVGTINTGTIGRIVQSVDAVQKSGNADVAAALTTLTNGIQHSQALALEQKNQALELISAVAKQAALPPAERQNSVALVLLERVATIAALANDLTEVSSKWLPVLVAAFSAATGA